MRTFSRGVALAVVAALLAPVGIAAAETSTPSTSAPSTSTPSTSAPFTTPNTDNCPYRLSPPKAVDTSEVPRPGQTISPLPVPAAAVGGPLLSGCGVITPGGSPALPDSISASSWAITDLDTGEILAAKDPHGRYRPASTLKTLLSIVALKELDLSTVVTGTDADANMDGSRVGIGAGGRYSNLQLMQGLLLESGNDAANALATELGGTSETLAKMNQTADELGAHDTRAVTICGLDAAGMATSAVDLSLFFRQAMRNAEFAKIVATEQVQFPGFPGHPSFAIANDNAMLYNYPGSIGGKTGYTDDARQTYVGAAQRYGRRLAVTLLDGDATYLRPWEQAARLLDWGFALKGTGIGNLDDQPQSAAAAHDPGAPALAAPPATYSRVQSMQSVSSTTHQPIVRFAIGLVGGLVVCLLVLAALSVNRRRR